MLYITEEATPIEEAPAEETDTATKPAVPKKGLKLSYDEYKQMANLMVLYMRKMEEESEGNLYSVLKPLKKKEKISPSHFWLHPQILYKSLYGLYGGGYSTLP